MRVRSLILHPFLLAVYPVLSIYAANSDRLRPIFTLRPLILSLLLCLIVLVLMWFVVRDWRRAGLVTSLFTILFFTYGHLYTLLEGATLAGIAIGRHRMLLTLWFTLFLLGSWFIWKRLDNVERATSITNLVAVLALAFPLTSLLVLNLRQLNSATAGVQDKFVEPDLSRIERQPDELPDIYYIILDAYARQDVLQTYYGYDNSDFLVHLENLGFTIADQSRANYGQTGLSIASALNMDYLQTAIDDLDSERTDFIQVIPLIKHSRVREHLESFGYQTIAFSSGYSITEMDDVDMYLEPGSSGVQGNVLISMSKIGQVNPFEVLVVQSTAAVLMTDLVSRCVSELNTYQASTPEERQARTLNQAGWFIKACDLFDGLHETLNYPFREHRERIQFAFDTLPELVETSEPHFVFAHIVAPHFPYVFGPDGEVGSHLEETGLPFWYFTGSHKDYIDGYIGQIAYVDKRMQEILGDILADSEREPIIIIQADHGPDSTSLVGDQTADFLSERFPILNAYYLPISCQQDLLYPSITPVNSFRAVLNACFEGDFELLEDRSYWSEYDRPYQFNDVTDRIKPGTRGD